MSKPSVAARALDRYSTVAIILHWAIAALLIGNIVLGLNIDGFKGLAKFQAIQLHKSMGITVLMLTILRLAWRLVNAAPSYPTHMPAWEKTAAAVTHWGFYFLLLALPLTGWAMVSASPLNLPTLLYKTVPWPHLGFIHALPIGQRKGLEHLLMDVHENLARVTVILLILHVGAALKHQFRDRDVVLWRMFPLPGLRPGPTKPQET